MQEQSHSPDLNHHHNLCFIVHLFRVELQVNLCEPKLTDTMMCFVEYHVTPAARLIRVLQFNSLPKEEQKYKFINKRRIKPLTETSAGSGALWLCITLIYTVSFSLLNILCYGLR